MAGIPNVNCICFVLWRNRCIPSSEPIEPPIIAIINNVFSGMRHIFFMARLLSTSIDKKPARFIIIRYIKMPCITSGVISFNPLYIMFKSRSYEIYFAINLYGFSSLIQQISIGEYTKVRI